MKSHVLSGGNGRPSPGARPRYYLMSTGGRQGRQRFDQPPAPGAQSAGARAGCGSTSMASSPCLERDEAGWNRPRFPTHFKSGFNLLAGRGCRLAPMRFNSDFGKYGKYGGDQVVVRARSDRSSLPVQRGQG